MGLGYESHKDRTVCVCLCVGGCVFVCVSFKFMFQWTSTLMETPSCTFQSQDNKKTQRKIKHRTSITTSIMCMLQNVQIPLTYLSPIFFPDLYELVHSACLCVNRKCKCIAGNGYHPSQQRDVSGDMCVYLHSSRACVWHTCDTGCFEVRPLWGELNRTNWSKIDKSWENS